MDKTFPTHTTTHIVWFIWHERNKAIFEESKFSIQTIFYKPMNLQNKSISFPKDRPLRNYLITHQKDFVLA